MVMIHSQHEFYCAKEEKENSAEYATIKLLIEIRRKVNIFQRNCLFIKAIVRNSQRNYRFRILMGMQVDGFIIKYIRVRVLY